MRRPRREVVEALAVEYARLFVGPGPHIAPYASVHWPGGSGELLGAPAAALEAVIEAADYELSAGYRRLPDHVGIVLDLMAWLANTEAEAWMARDYGAAAEALRREVSFLDEHMLPWIPTFCERVAEVADVAFYRDMANLTVEYLRFDEGDLARTLQLVDAGETGISAATGP